LGKIEKEAGRTGPGAIRCTENGKASKAAQGELTAQNAEPN